MITDKLGDIPTYTSPSSKPPVFRYKTENPWLLVLSSIGWAIAIPAIVVGAIMISKGV